MCLEGGRDRTATARRVGRVELVCGGGNQGSSFVLSIFVVHWERVGEGEAERI